MFKDPPEARAAFAKVNGLSYNDEFISARLSFAAVKQSKTPKVAKATTNTEDDDSYTHLKESTMIKTVVTPRTSTKKALVSTRIKKTEVIPTNSKIAKIVPVPTYSAEKKIAKNNIAPASPQKEKECPTDKMLKKV